MKPDLATAIQLHKAGGLARAEPAYLVILLAWVSRRGGWLAERVGGCGLFLDFCRGFARRVWSRVGSGLCSWSDAEVFIGTGLADE